MGICRPLLSPSFIAALRAYLNAAFEPALQEIAHQVREGKPLDLLSSPRLHAASLYFGLPSPSRLQTLAPLLRDGASAVRIRAACRELPYCAIRAMLH
jgi:hypothetical protein